MPISLENENVRAEGSSSPAVVSVTRGNAVESTHLVDVVICDAEGRTVASWGDAEKVIYPRSSIKALQAICLVESGAPEALGLTDAHLALTCSSHNGEPVHVKAASEILALAKLDTTCLECGAQIPSSPEDYVELVRSGTSFGRVHNNCSGKHAGFLAFASHVGLETTGYINFDHQVQKEIRSVLQAVTGEVHNDENYGIDGCSIPNHRLPLSSLAKAFAKFGVGESDNRSRSSAMIKLRDACVEHPYMVAGSDRVCTKIMKSVPSKVFVKVGAEGVYTGCIPHLGLGIAMKARDGAMRAVESCISNMIFDLIDGSTRNISKESLFEYRIFDRNGSKSGLVISEY